ncbi:MAG: short-chain dehydrogenase/reductase [Caulobacter sp.]|nr:short-chain dehydrogenase/reductase [Caulobacter sp.]
MDLDFTEKRVLIIGGSSGIGLACAQAFAARGADVAVTGTRANKADYGDGASALEPFAFSTLNVATPGAVDRWIPPFEAVDVVILSQGAVEYRRKEFEADAFRHVVEVNLTSLMACAQKLAPALEARGGSLIVISSVGGLRATRGNPAYSASKAGAIHLTRTLGDAWAGRGIRVNGIAPGLIATKMTAVTTSDPARLQERLKGIPLNRLGRPEEVAGVALFLASPLAAYIVGETIVVDGGRTLS